MTLTNSDDSASVTDLLERRAQLQGWIDRLGEIGGDVSARVAERVRTDYDQRMTLLLQELGSHSEAIHADLDRLRDELRTCGERYETAVEVLEEANLRFRIGELGESEWEERRPALEDDVTVSARGREEMSAELSRLEELLTQIEEAHGQSGAQAHELAIAPDVLGLEVQSSGFEVNAGSQDLAFLEELDRAIQGEGNDISYSLAETDLEPAAGAGAKCADCGYTNDVGARYCGVCGVDLN